MILPRFRFEQMAAYIVGVLLSSLEIFRRGMHIDFVPAYIDDFIAGGLLLYAASAVSRRRDNGPVLLVLAWAVLCGGLYYSFSFFGQIQNIAAWDVSGLPGIAIVWCKGILFAAAVVSLFLSVKSAAR
jgi:hypothetical protein